MIETFFTWILIPIGLTIGICISAFLVCAVGCMIEWVEVKHDEYQARVRKRKEAKDEQET